MFFKIPIKIIKRPPTRGKYRCLSVVLLNCTRAFLRPHLTNILIIIHAAVFVTLSADYLISFQYLYRNFTALFTSIKLSYFIYLRLHRRHSSLTFGFPYSSSPAAPFRLSRPLTRSSDYFTSVSSHMINVRVEVYGSNLF